MIAAISHHKYSCTIGEIEELFHFNLSMKVTTKPKASIELAFSKTECPKTSLVQNISSSQTQLV
jgi:hypothetical protein